jgi:hypothetical protein
MFLTLRQLTLLVAILLCLSSNTSFAGIGKVTEEKGIAEITRQKNKVGVKNGTDVESMDNVQTGNGVVGITFEDNTKVRVTENSKLVIDDFVYDPKKKGAGKLALKVAMGTVRYASGNIAHENNKNVAVNTPTATIAVRGTAFTMTVDEVGQSMIILLPNPDGTVGSIEVKTLVGTVVLNQAFQATVATSSEIKPLKPVLLSLNESMIDNMLIVRPPKEMLQKIQDDIKEKQNALDYNALDQNALDVKVFKDPYANFDELSINALDVDYLTNALDNFLMAAFTVGYNSSNQVYIFDKNTYWQIVRNVKHNATIMINKNNGYNITLIQDGTTVQLQNQDSTNNNIYIKQISK